MDRKEELMLEKEFLDSDIDFLFYTDDIKDRLMLIRQAMNEIEKTGYILNTADEYIDPHFWSDKRYEEIKEILKNAEKVYAELLSLE
ncbi:MAG TPA: hypothetical protein OIM34_05260 [Ruminococcus bromii]|nr:hypothetical protein [Ruminococcus bromii]